MSYTSIPGIVVIQESHWICRLLRIRTLTVHILALLRLVRLLAILLRCRLILRLRLVRLLVLLLISGLLGNILLRSSISLLIVLLIVRHLLRRLLVLLLFRSVLLRSRLILRLRLVRLLILLLISGLLGSILLYGLTLRHLLILLNRLILRCFAKRSRIVVSHSGLRLRLRLWLHNRLRIRITHRNIISFRSSPRLRLKSRIALIDHGRISGCGINERDKGYKDSHYDHDDPDVIYHECSHSDRHHHTHTEIESIFGALAKIRPDPAVADQIQSIDVIEIMYTEADTQKC